METYLSSITSDNLFVQREFTTHSSHSSPGVLPSHVCHLKDKNSVPFWKYSQKNSRLFYGPSDKMISCTCFTCMKFLSRILQFKICTGKTVWSELFVQLLCIIHFKTKYYQSFPPRTHLNLILWIFQLYFWAFQSVGLDCIANVLVCEALTGVGWQQGSSGQ